MRTEDRGLKGELELPRGAAIYKRSVTEIGSAVFFLARVPEGKVLGIRGDASGFEGGCRGTTFLGPLTPSNAAVLRAKVAWLRPQPVGVRTSAGLGDRLGPATPGHIRALRRVDGIVPILAQQSVRENERAGRTPRQVLDDATWGIFQEGWHDPWGADADHLKTVDDVDSFVAVGYRNFTVDPGDHVDNRAQVDPSSVLEAKVQRLPWDTLEDTARDMARRYIDRSFDLGGLALALDEEALWRAAAKYGRAVAHTVRMYRHLVERMADRTFALEVSVDETATPTSPEEHLFIANELRRLEVRWVSLAPRYLGRFEKGVDYIGDLGQFEAALAKHAAIARAVGPYKLSIHSGSDKFSIYPIIARLTEGLVHLKTAGTSYLEALRVLARLDSTLFRKILRLSIARYPEDRVTYRVSAEVDRVPAPDELSDDDLPDLLTQFDARQVLHVAFGSVIEQFGTELKASLARHEQAYGEALEEHFIKHLVPLTSGFPAKRSEHTAD